VLAGAQMSTKVIPYSLKAELNEKGQRMTPQREIIFAIFRDLPQGEHLSVEDLPKYRTKRLKRRAEQGLIEITTQLSRLVL
jgi:hypothetical protein